MKKRSVLSGLLCLLPLMLGVTASRATGMERGVAIAEPDVLRALDQSRLGLARLLGADPASSAADLFALPSMAAVRDATDRDFSRYVADRRDARDRFVLFDRDALHAPGTRLDLVGIINRMDRAYVTPESCGEIRLIYRLVVNRDGANRDQPPSRLPMTLNLVLAAKPAAARITCAELAKRWLGQADLPATVSAADHASKLAAAGGVLEWIVPEAIARIELNVQVVHDAAEANESEGRADYMMKVFRYVPARKSFDESPLENQIDIERIRTDARLAVDLKQWLFQPAHLADLDSGAIVLPERFLARSTINETPAASAQNGRIGDLFPEDEVVSALATASAAVSLQNILSPAGFARRLDDITCSGCHQTRAIGGFHFPGKERPGNVSASAVVAAASPHFFGDQERRRDILAAFRDGRAPDLSRGFSARPQPRRSVELIGSTYVNGWGAICALPGATDRSFASWTCAGDLSCQPAPGAKAPRTGFCFPSGR